MTFVEHHGVKGMKWGQHKIRGPAHPDFVDTKHLRNRRTKELSNAEIQKINSRIEMESKYRKLNPNTADRGHAYVKKLLAFTTTATSLIALSQTDTGKRVTEAIIKKLKTQAGK